MFKAVSSQIDFAVLTEDILSFWKENQTFKKSIENRPKDNRWTFLDGPPFITGTPHYGSLLSSMPKDVFGRYWTMKGYRVRRVWGWDGHGLPAENKVENKLGIKSKREIEEKIGVKRFIEECLNYVNQVSSEWEWYIDHIGRWVDFQNAYKTWDLNYMESVMWVFKQIHDKGYIYKGLKVILYCPHCATPVSNFEVAMDAAENYLDITEPSAIYKYPLKEEKNTYLLAWSTTPWNKIVTPALAVNSDLTYIKVKQGGEFYILGKKTLKMLKDDPYEILEEFEGKELLGKEFIPHYNFYPVERGKKAFIVVAGDFVTEDEGTGVVTIAAYGEEDLAVMQKENIQIVLHLNEEGKLKDNVPNWAGMYYLEVNEKVNEDLKKRGLLYDAKPYVHSVAHCWRCHTQLYYAPLNAWFVDVQKLKPRLKKNNEVVNWFPKHFKYGRFLKSMESAPDWNISRNRYWGSPVPVWECECGERIVPGSIKELEELSSKKITNLHKPEIDEVFIPCAKCSKKAKRVPEVLDSWIEAGSASFAERHFPFNKEENLEEFFPPDFVAEYTGQLRAWFFILHIVGTALYDSPAFKNVLVEGVMQGNDGRKMSKNYGNYPDPRGLIQKYGGDAIRLYLMSTPVMKGEDVNFSDDGVPEVVRGFMLIFWNSYKYFTDYANMFNWSYTENKESKKLTVIDRWVLASLNEMMTNLYKAYEGYDTVSAIKTLREFAVNDFSTWYIRRNRERISNNDNLEDRNTSLTVLYEVLVTFSQVLAPLAPFISEEIYRNLTGKESVHLSDYPQVDKSLIDRELIEDMKKVRQLVESGHSLRKEAGIKLRQPLAKFAYYLEDRLDPELERILAEELNVKEVEHKKSTEKTAKGELDTKITPELKAEGEVRELARQVQQLRKDRGLTLKDRIKIFTPYLPEDKTLIAYLLRQTNAEEVEKADNLSIEVLLR